MRKYSTGPEIREISVRHMGKRIELETVKCTRTWRGIGHRAYGDANGNTRGHETGRKAVVGIGLVITIPTVVDCVV